MRSHGVGVLSEQRGHFAAFLENAAAVKFREKGFNVLLFLDGGGVRQERLRVGGGFAAPLFNFLGDLVLLLDYLLEDLVFGLLLVLVL